MADHHAVEREKLYEEVWAEPVIKVSKRYGISDVALAKICRKMQIPVPERGYWARLAHGQKITKTPLPPRGEDVPQKIEIHPVQPSSWNAAIEAQNLEPVPVAQDLKSPHKLSTKLQKSLSSQRPDSYGRVSSRDDEIDVRVFLASLPRVLRFVDAFIKAAEERGYTFRPHDRDHIQGLAIVINSQPIQFSISEASRRTSPRPAEGVDRFSRSYVEPEYTPTGKLTFKILEYVGDRYEPSWTDRVGNPLEARLAEILHALKQAGGLLRERAEERARETELYAAREEERRKAEIKHKKLVQDLSDWSTAQSLRAFTERLEQELDGHPEKRSEFAESWLEWVKRHINSIDPFSAGLDDFLEHYQQFGWDKMTRRR